MSPLRSSASAPEIEYTLPLAVGLLPPLALPAVSGFLAPAFIATSGLGTLQSLARCPGLLHFQHTETLSEQWLAKWPLFRHVQQVTSSKSCGGALGANPLEG